MSFTAYDANGNIKVTADTLPANVALTDAENAFTQDQHIGKANTAMWKAKITGATDYVRVGDAIDASGNYGMVSMNLNWTGTEWDADDVTLKSTAYFQTSAAGDDYDHTFYSLVAGANPRDAAFLYTFGITKDGLVDLPIGQLQFPAAQNASSGANVLDDYEEGTWTPTDVSGASLAFSQAYGTYVKVGQLVVAAFRVVYPVTANGSNTAIGSMPFTVETFGGVLIWGGFITATDVNVHHTVLAQPAATYFNMQTMAGVAVINSVYSLKSIYGVLVYRASA